MLDFDNGVRRTHERIEALARAHKLSKNDPFYYASMRSLDSSDLDEMRKFGDSMDLRDVKLVIVDNLGVVSGGLDENSIKMAGVMSNWRRLAEDHNLAVILIHHQTKGYDKSEGTRIGASLRGHSSIEAAIDLGLLAERDELSPIVNIRATKTRGADVSPFSAIFSYVNKTGTEELQEARFCGVPVSHLSGVHQIEQAILQTVSDSPGINKGDVVSIVKSQLKRAGKNKIRREIERLQESGKLKMEYGKSGANTYFPGEQNDGPEAERVTDLQPLKNTA